MQIRCSGIIAWAAEMIGGRQGHLSALMARVGAPT